MSAPPEPCADDRHEAGLAGAGVLEVVRKVRVECHGVAVVEVVGAAVADELQAAGGHDRGLAAAGLVDRRGAPGARGRARGPHRPGGPRAPAGQRRGAGPPWGAPGGAPPPPAGGGGGPPPPPPPPPAAP